MFAALEVESNEYCREILRLRMAEQLLPSAPIECDAATVRPPRSAKGVGGGFPCQVSPGNGLSGVSC